MGNINLSNDQLELFNQIETSNTNFFIQGQAGTGKSTFLQFLKSFSKKKICVVCPTAVAALNVEGATIHSLFRLPPADYIVFDKLELARKTATILNNIQLLIIDEISMVRPDILDAIDLLCKQARGINLPFGGIQLLLIGDLCQLPPIIKNGVVSDIFYDNYGYKNPYFFDSNAYKSGNFKVFQFTKIFRQQDPELIENLSKIRLQQDLTSAIQYFNTAKINDDSILDYAVTITPFRNVADSINTARLSKILGEPKMYIGTTSGEFDDIKDTPAPKMLMLKVGALVMFNKNSQSWINGSLGLVEKLEDEYIEVRLLATNELVSVKRESWQKYKYDYNRELRKVEETIVGEFVQFPLQLGYALTIHKAQGKTLDKVIINLSKGAFAHGQLYVALSRTRYKKDMHILTPLKTDDVIVDRRIIEFLENIKG